MTPDPQIATDAVPVDLTDGIVRYLASRPYAEVIGLMLPLGQVVAQREQFQQAPQPVPAEQGATPRGRARGKTKE